MFSFTLINTLGSVSSISLGMSFITCGILYKVSSNSVNIFPYIGVDVLCSSGQLVSAYFTATIRNQEGSGTDALPLPGTMSPFSSSDIVWIMRSPGQQFWKIKTTESPRNMNTCSCAPLSITLFVSWVQVPGYSQLLIFRPTENSWLC